MNKPIIAACALAAALFMSSCGGSKNVQVGHEIPYEAPKSSLGDAIEMDKCQVCAEDPSATSPRAWAKYNDFDMKNAQRYATASARADLASQIAAFVQDAIELYNENYKNSVTDGVRAKRVQEASDRAKGHIKTVSEELIRGSRVIMSSFYRQANGTIDAYVCVEMDFNSVLNQLKQDAEIQRVISDTEKARVDRNVKDFEKAMKESFELMREKKAQGL